MSRHARRFTARIAGLALLALGLVWAPVATTAHAVEHFAAQSAPEGMPASDGPCAECVALAAFGAATTAAAVEVPALAPAFAPPAVCFGASALPLTLAFRERAPPAA
ncbi:MAG TPA: hypothetical protein VLW45_13610 [Pelomicrobium sp.]|nr:hypothetical protein [Pelomicrobium sp.]